MDKDHVLLGYVVPVFRSVHLLDGAGTRKPAKIRLWRQEPHLALLLAGGPDPITRYIGQKTSKCTEFYTNY